MEKELGIVEQADLGIDDHGIFGFNISFDFGGSHQATGWYALGNRSDAIERLLRFFHPYGHWKNIVGTHVFVHRDSPYGKIIGLETLAFAPGGTRVILLSELFD